MPHHGRGRELDPHVRSPSYISFMTGGSPFGRVSNWGAYCIVAVQLSISRHCSVVWFSMHSAHSTWSSTQGWLGLCPMSSIHR